MGYKPSLYILEVGSLMELLQSSPCAFLKKNLFQTDSLLLFFVEGSESRAATLNCIANAK